MSPLWARTLHLLKRETYFAIPLCHRGEHFSSKNIISDSNLSFAPVCLVSPDVGFQESGLLFWSQGRNPGIRKNYPANRTSQQRGKAQPHSHFSLKTENRLRTCSPFHSPPIAKLFCRRGCSSRVKLCRPWRRGCHTYTPPSLSSMGLPNLKFKSTEGSSVFQKQPWRAAINLAQVGDHPPALLLTPNTVLPDQTLCAEECRAGGLSEGTAYSVAQLTAISRQTENHNLRESTSQSGLIVEALPPRFTVNPLAQRARSRVSWSLNSQR